MRVTVFDFDKTIYAGDSMIDFYIYCLLRRPYILRFLPTQVAHVCCYLLGREDKTRMKNGFLAFLRGIEAPEEQVRAFWQKNEHKLKPWYMGKKYDTPVIVSASPEFLLRPIIARLRARVLIATKVDTRTGRIHGKNCYGEEKVARLLEELPAVQVLEAYSDSLADLPILRLARRAYMVRRHTIIPLEEYRTGSLVPPLLRALSHFHSWINRIISGRE